MNVNIRFFLNMEGVNPWPTLGQAFGAVRIGYFAEVYSQTKIMTSFGLPTQS